MDISKVSPDLVIGIVSVLGALGGWLWRKARGEKQRDLSDLLDEVITHEVDEALDDGATVYQIRERLEAAAQKLCVRVLGRKMPQKYIALAVEWGVQEFKKRVRLRAAAQDAKKAFDRMPQAMSGVIEAFTPKPVEERTVKPFGEGMIETEIVK